MLAYYTINKSLSRTDYIICGPHRKMKMGGTWLKKCLRITKWQRQIIKCGALLSTGPGATAQAVHHEANPELEASCFKGRRGEWVQVLNPPFPRVLQVP